MLDSALSFSKLGFELSFKKIFISSLSELHVWKGSYKIFCEIHKLSYKTIYRYANKGKIPWNKGKCHSKETKEKISKSLRGEKGSFYGKHHTQKTKDKISKKNIGKRRTQEAKNKMIEFRLGKSVEELNHKSNCRCVACRSKRGESKGEGNGMYAKYHTQSTKDKLSISKSGENNPMSMKNRELRALIKDSILGER